MRYLLDANTYIQAKNLHYRMHVVPGFWDWLDLQFGNGAVGSVRMVYDELVGSGDELSAWVRSRESQFVTEDDSDTQAIFTEIANFIVEDPNLSEPYVSQFLTGADPWLIAKAHALGAEVVTHERRVGSGSKKVKVPNICEAFGVSCCNTFDLLGNLSARLVLEP